MSRFRATAILLLTTLPLWSEPVDWTLGDQSRALLEGDSTIRSWSVASDTVHGGIQLPWSAGEVDEFYRWVLQAPGEAAGQINTVLKAAPPAVRAELKIKVKELESGNDRMERDMREALKAGKHPWIVFTFTGVTNVIDVSKQHREGCLVLRTTGSLRLAGVEKDVQLDFNLSPADNGGYLLVSQRTFRMTDFGITPPTALFGLLKAHDEVDIHYRIHLIPLEPEGE